MGSRSIRPLSILGDPSSSETPQTKNIARKKGNNVRAQGESYRCATTINILSDDVLLEIFDSFREIPFYYSFRVQVVWSWQSLVHVCRRWRQIIFESPHRLNLQILCTEKSPVKKNLRIWPTLPIVIKYNYTGRSLRPAGIGNVLAALRQPNRVCHVELNVTSSMLEKMVALLQEPFPELTHIDIFSESTDGGMGVLPNGFLGGSAPRLRELYFLNLSFPSLPKVSFVHQQPHLPRFSQHTPD